MPEIDNQQRVELKQQAARMAIADANVSQWLAGAAAVVALFSAPHAAVLGVGAAAMGVCGNYRQAVANDPAREDFDQVWITEASYDESTIIGDEALVSIQRFVGQVFLIQDALYALLCTLERLDGALVAENEEAASLQADAARQNAKILADLQENRWPLAEGLLQVVASLRQGTGFDAVSLDQVVSLYRDAWGEPPAAPGAALTGCLSPLSDAADDLLEPFDPAEAHPILSATDMPADIPPLDDTFLASLNENNETLRKLVTE